MDKLEQFIVDQKEQFNESRNPEEGWDKLNRRLGSKQPDWTVFWKVAAVVFFFSSIVLMALLISGKDTDKASSMASGPDTFEDFYFKQINQKMNEYCFGIWLILILPTKN